MRRRDFIALLGGTAVEWPLVARTQQMGKVYRIGILETIPAVRNAANLDALRKGLRDFGYVEGQNLVIEYRNIDRRMVAPSGTRTSPRNWFVSMSTSS